MFAYVNFPLINGNAALTGGVPLVAPPTIGALNQGPISQVPHHLATLFNGVVDPSAGVNQQPPQIYHGAADQGMMQAPQPQNAQLCYLFPVQTSAPVCLASAIQDGCTSIDGPTVTTNPVTMCQPLTQPRGQLIVEAPLDLSKTNVRTGETTLKRNLTHVDSVASPTAGEPMVKRSKLEISPITQITSPTPKPAMKETRYPSVDAEAKRDRYPSGTGSVALSVSDSAYNSDETSNDGVPSRSADGNINVPSGLDDNVANDSISIDPEELQKAKKQRRRERNKIAAQKLRNKTRQKKKTLDEEAKELEEKNQVLRDKVTSIEEELALLKKNLLLFGSTQTPPIVKNPTGIRVSSESSNDSIKPDSNQQKFAETCAVKSRLTSPATPCAIRPLTPDQSTISRPVTPITHCVTTLSRPVTPVTPSVTSLSRPVTPVTPSVTPLSRPITPVTRPVTPATPYMTETTLKTFTFDNNQTYLELSKLSQNSDIITSSPKHSDAYVEIPQCLRNHVPAPCRRNTDDLSEMYSDEDDLMIDIDYHEEAEQQLLPPL